MRILIATDAWRPQVNGVVRSIEALVREAHKLGAEVEVLSSQGFRTVALPTYPDIRLALARPSAIRRRIEAFAPDHIHIATEGPIGVLTRQFCRTANRTFTTSYHTAFPDYIAARFPIPRTLIYAALRWFHNGGNGLMVSTSRLAEELERRGFRNLMRWSRGVDAELFRPRSRSTLPFGKPLFLFVGRVAVEKNLEAFLALDLPGSKVVVGDGPARAELQQRFPDAQFVGTATGEKLAEAYASADVFVFPSRTDTFGIVMLEAMASGLPVAAYPVPGPLDVVENGKSGVLDEDLAVACHQALALSRTAARERALSFSWSASAEQFLDNIRRVRAAGSADIAVKESYPTDGNMTATGLPGFPTS